MRLETEFIKLPLLFDVEQLKKEISQFAEEEWMAHATGYSGNMSIPLISLHGEFNDAVHGPMKTTSALKRCAYIQQIMTTFGEVFSRSRLMRLESGCEVPPHVDINYHWYNRVRVHIPITTTEDVLFYCGDQHVHMAAGECWIFDSWSEHTVKNNSDKTRVHLVLDTAGSPRFWELVERGDWPFKNRQQQVCIPQLVSYEPGRPTNVRTETYNAPLVLSPGEIENLVGDLTDDIDSTSDPDGQGKQEFADLTKSFVRAWREVWSEHGMKPGGWPLYHELVTRADKASYLLNPELVLASNGVELGGAFRGLVLFSAINEEFAPLYLDKDEVPDVLKKAIRSFSTGEKAAKDSGGAAKSPGRNEPCHCGSGKRFKHCHGRVS